MYVNDGKTSPAEGKGVIGKDSQSDQYGQQRVPYLLAEDVSVDLNSTDAQTIYTATSTAAHVVVTHVVTKEPSVDLTTAAWGFGWDASGIDVVASATHTALDASTKYAIDTAKAGAALGTASGTFKTKPTIAQGSAATAKVDVLGYVIDA